MNNKIATGLFVLLVISGFSIATGLLLWVTENGIGIGFDSISYINAANRLLQSSTNMAGLSPHYPPLYTLLLALAGAVGGEVEGSARWLHAILYGFNTVLVGAAIYYGTRRNLPATLLGMGVFLTSAPVLAMHVYALSEPLFFTLSLSSYLLFAFYIQSGRNRYLVLASLLAGLAVSTRYVGVALIPPLAVGIWFLVKKPARQKIKALGTLLVLSAAPAALWILRNLLIFQSATNRSVVYHHRSIRKIARLVIELLYSYLFGGAGSSKYVQAVLVGALVLILLGMLLFLLKKQVFSSPPNRFGAAVMVMGLLYAVSYALVVLFSMFFVDAATQVNDRIILPVCIMFIPAVITLLFFFSFENRKYPVWALITAAVLLSMGAGLPSALTEIKTLHADGIGLNSVMWNESDTLRLVNEIPPGRAVYSNGEVVILYKTSLQVYPLPRIYESTTRIENPQYPAQLGELCEQVRRGQAVIIFFDRIGREYVPKEYEIRNRCDLPVLVETNDGVIWGVPQDG